MSTKEYNQLQKPVLLYDGYCNLCSWLVRLVKRRDSNRRILLFPMQNLHELPLPLPEEITIQKKSVVLVSLEGKVFEKSQAVMRVLKTLGGFWFVPWALLFVIPNPIRNFAYDLVARNRYKWFGERKTCYLP
jgi:predicted DCC family thiol-disulfide oxidoreductase YuxK